MKVFFFQNILDEAHPVDNEWSSIQEERIDRNAVLNFVVGICQCGARSLYKFEYYKNYQVLEDYDGIEEVELICPGCGTKLGVSIRCNTYEGIQVRLLESWSKDVQVEGFTKLTVEEELRIAKDKLKELSKLGIGPIIIEEMTIQNIPHHAGQELVCKLRLPTYSRTNSRRFLENAAEQFKGQILFYLLDKYYEGKEKP